MREVMKEKTKVKIVGGATARKGRTGIVTTEQGTGKNQGKVEVYIDRLGHFWYDPADLEAIEQPATEQEVQPKFSVGNHDVDPKELKPHPANPAIYGTDEDLSDLLDLIPQFGIQRRLIVNPNGEIISGNRRNRSALKLELATVPIEVRAFKSKEEEEQLLLSENATRTKTTFQKVREGQKWQELESGLAAARRKATQNNQAARAEVQIFAPQTLKGKTRDIIAKRVGLGSGYNYQKACQVVEEIDRLTALGKGNLGEVLKYVLNEMNINTAHKLLKRTDRYREKVLETIAEDKSMSLKEAKKLLNEINPPDRENALGVGMRVRVKQESPIYPRQRGEIVSLPNKNKAIVLFEDGTRQLIDRCYLEPAKENLPPLPTGSPPETLATESPSSSIDLNPTTPDPPAAPIPPIESNQATERPSNPSKTSKQQPSSVKEELDRQQEELGLGTEGDSVLPESDRLDELQHSNPAEVDDRPFATPAIDLKQINPNALIVMLVNTLDYLGAEQIRTINRAVAKRKKELVKDAATGLADSEEEAIEIVRAVLKKYPNAVNQAMGDF